MSFSVNPKINKDQIILATVHSIESFERTDDDSVVMKISHHRVNPEFMQIFGDQTGLVNILQLTDRDGQAQGIWLRFEPNEFFKAIESLQRFYARDEQNIKDLAETMADWFFNEAKSIEAMPYGAERDLREAKKDPLVRELCKKILKAAQVDDMGGCYLCQS